MRLPVRWTQPESAPFLLPLGGVTDSFLTRRTGLTQGLENAVKAEKLDPSIMYKQIVKEVNEQWFIVARRAYLPEPHGTPERHAKHLPQSIVTAEYGPLRIAIVAAVFGHVNSKSGVFWGRFRVIACLYSELETILAQQFKRALDDDGRAQIAGKWSTGAIEQTN